MRHRPIRVADKKEGTGDRLLLFTAVASIQCAVFFFGYVWRTAACQYFLTYILWPILPGILMLLSFMIGHKPTKSPRFGFTR